MQQNMQCENNTQNTEINTNKSTHSKIGSVWQTKPNTENWPTLCYIIFS